MTEHELTIKAWAKTLGIARYTLQRYVNKGHLPNAKTLVKLYKATNGEVEPNDYYALDGEPKRAKPKRAKPKRAKPKRAKPKRAKPKR